MVQLRMILSLRCRTAVESCIIIAGSPPVCTAVRHAALMTIAPMEPKVPGRAGASCRSQSGARARTKVGVYELA